MVYKPRSCLYNYLNFNLVTALMANLKTSIKDVRQNKRRAVFNGRIKKRYKAAVKKYNLHIEAGEKKEAQAYLPRVYKLLDKAAKGGVMKKGSASRRKSRLAGKLNTLSARKNVKTAKKGS